LATAFASPRTADGSTPTRAPPLARHSSQRIATLCPRSEAPRCRPLIPQGDPGPLRQPARMETTL
jgi:hypothetical protein